MLIFSNIQTKSSKTKTSFIKENVYSKTNLTEKCMGEKCKKYYVPVAILS